MRGATRIWRELQIRQGQVHDILAFLHEQARMGVSCRPRTLATLKDVTDSPPFPIGGNDRTDGHILGN